MEFPKYEGVDFNNEANNDRTNDLTEDTKASNSSNKSSQSSQNMQPKSKSLSFYTQIDSYSANQSQMFKKVGNE